MTALRLCRGLVSIGGSRPDCYPGEHAQLEDGHTKGHRRGATRILRLLPKCLIRGRLTLRYMLNHSPDLDGLFHALADPARRAIVERLSRGPASVSELARPLPMSLPSVMQHLGILEAAGLVTSQKAGRVRVCAFEPQAFRQAEQWIGARRTEWELRLDQLGEYLKTLDNEGDSRESSF
jgi:DNA-binding transcriptional ArsR family regulator